MKLITALVSLCLTLSICAQDLPKNNIFFNWGFTATKTQDQVFSPLIYEGSSMGNLQLGYQFQNQLNRHKVLVEFESSELNGAKNISFTVGDRQTRQDSPNNYYRIHYSYNRVLGQKGNFDYFAGANLDIQAHLLNYQFGLSDDDGFIFAHTLSAGGGVSWHPDEKNHVTLGAHYPLMAFIARPTYNIVDNERIQNEKSDFGYFHKNGKFSFPGVYHQLFVDLTYTRNISNRLDGIFTYLHRSWQYDEPLPIAISKNNLLLGIQFKF